MLGNNFRISCLLHNNIGEQIRLLKYPFNGRLAFLGHKIKQKFLILYRQIISNSKKKRNIYSEQDAFKGIFKQITKIILTKKKNTQFYM